MPKGNRVAVPRGENNRCIQGFGQRQRVFVSTRILNATAGHDHRLFRLPQHFGCLPDRLVACRRHILRAVAPGLLQILELGDVGQHVARQI